MFDTPDLRKQVRDCVEKLPPERLAVVLDFLAYLIEREDNDATTALLAMSGFAEELKAAEHEANAGELIDWHMIRRDV